MAEICDKCGASYALVGKAHNCNPMRVPDAPVEIDWGPDVGKEIIDGAVNAVNAPPKRPVNKAVNKSRGAYPDSSKRREYMREYMRKKRTFGKGKI